MNGENELELMNRCSALMIDSTHVFFFSSGVISAPVHWTVYRQTPRHNSRLQQLSRIRDSCSRYSQREGKRLSLLQFCYSLCNTRGCMAIYRYVECPCLLIDWLIDEQKCPVVMGTHTVPFPFKRLKSLWSFIFLCFSSTVQK